MPLPAIPTIVCICGSTRFEQAWKQATRNESLAGKIVLGLAVDRSLSLFPSEREAVEELHLRKIDLADEVLVLDVDGYTGPSTMAQMRYARDTDTPIRFWSEEYVHGGPNA